MNMKKLEYILLGLLVGFAMGACSSDDENAGVVDPVFPESQSYEIIPDQVCEISFEASTEWRVTTDKQWLKFIDETGKFQSLTGKAGKQTVKVTATNGALGFTDDKAQVKLTMGGKTQTIAEMNRAAKERVAKMYTVNGSDIIEINEFVDDAFNRTKMIGFEANFDWKIDVESFPKWLFNAGSENSNFENLCGEAGQTVNLQRMASLDTKLEARYQDLSGYITIRSVDGNYSYQFPVKATGIEATKIQWLGGNTLSLKNGLIWDDKGNHLLRFSIYEDPVETDAPATCHALIRDNDFTPHFVEWDATNKTAKEVSAEDTWVEITQKEGGILTLQAKKNEIRGSRRIVLFLVPKGATVDYNSQFNPRNGNFNFDLYGYGMQLEQYGLSGGFEMWKQITTMKFEDMANVTEASNINEIAEKLNLKTTDNIYERSFTAAEWDMSNQIHIKPLGLFMSWNKFEYFNSKFESLGEMPTGWATSSWQKGRILDESYNDYPSLSLTSRIPFAEITDDCLYIVIRDNNDKDLGTFVIRKNNEATIK